MVRRAVAAVFLAAFATKAAADGAERNVWNEELTSTRTIVAEMETATRGAPEGGPERVLFMWSATCLVDGKTNTKITESEESLRAACEKWAKTPAARMQKRDGPTPYTAGKMNAQMLWAMYPHVQKSSESYPTATSEQKQMTSTCLMDALAAFGQTEGLTADRARACNRMAGITEDPKPSKGKPTK